MKSKHELDKSIKLCNKIVYKPYDGGKPNILLGIVLGEDDLFIYFKTAKKEYRIAKTQILEIEDTTEVFQNE